MQQLNVSLSIPIPSDKVLIEKVELERLKDESLEGVYWTMKDLEKRINRKQLWIKDNILYPPKFKKQLEEFVYYPESQGQTWLFHARKMAKFLDRNFSEIMKEETNEHSHRKLERS